MHCWNPGMPLTNLSHNRGSSCGQHVPGAIVETGKFIHIYRRMARAYIPGLIVPPPLLKCYIRTVTVSTSCLLSTDSPVKLISIANETDAVSENNSVMAFDWHLHCRESTQLMDQFLLMPMNNYITTNSMTVIFSCCSSQ